MLVALEEVYEILRSKRPLEPTRRLLGRLAEHLEQNSQEIALRASGGFQTAMQALGAASYPVPSPSRPNQTLVLVDDLDPLLQSERPRGDANQVALDLLRTAIAIRRAPTWSRPARAKALVELCQRLATAGQEAPPDSPQWLAAMRTVIQEELARLLPAGITINQDLPFDENKLRDLLADGVRAGVATAGRERWSNEPLSKMVEAFLAQEAQKKVGSKHRKDVPRRLEAFVSFLGENKAVRDITRTDIEDYRDLLDQLPAQFQLHFKTTDMRAAIKKNAQRKRPIKIIGKTNVDLKWLGPVCRLCEWLVQKEKIEKDPTIGVRSKQEETEAANTKRLPFKADQISRIFAITSDASPKTALYWLPLLMLTTGARPNELAQLRTDDLDLNFNGRPHLNVLCLVDDDDESVKPAHNTDDEMRRVKTAAGKRMIPLHPALIEAGFIQFVEERHRGMPKQLFRELRPDQHGFWSTTITRRINRIIRQRLGITNPKYSAYSFRHYFIDRCRKAKIPDEARMKIVGHQLRGIQGIYGNPVVLPHESQMINSITFEGIDFGKYFESRAGSCAASKQG